MEAKNKLKLTKTAVENLPVPPTGKQVLAWDTELAGFGIRVSPKGTRTFIIQRIVRGRERRFSIGRFGVKTVKEARAKAKSELGIISDGGDPIAERRAVVEAERQQRLEATRRQEYSVGALLKAYCEDLEQRGRSSHKNCRSNFAAYITGEAGKIRKAREPDPIVFKGAADATALEWVAVFRRIGAKSPRTAHMVRASVQAAYARGITGVLDPSDTNPLQKFGLTSNPIININAEFGRAGTRERTLFPEEMQVFLALLEGYDDLRSKAIELALYSGGQRPMQLLRVPTRLLNQSERTMLLYDRKGKKKNARPHLVPLAPHAFGIAAELHDRAKSMGSEHLISLTGKTILGVNELSRRIAEIRTAMKTSGKLPGGNFQMKDLRRTITTMLTELGVQKEHRCQLQSHEIGGIEDERYNMYSFLAEKRRAALILEKRLREIRDGKLESGNVVPLMEVERAAA